MALSKQLSDPLPDLPLQPVSPPSNFSFPKRDFGKDKVVKQGCLHSWFSIWPWLYYQARDDVVFCHICVGALKSMKMDKGRGDPAFTSSGFKNWKDATICFKKHETSASHKEACQVIVKIPSSYPDVGKCFPVSCQRKKARITSVCSTYYRTSAFYLDRALRFGGMVMRQIRTLCSCLNSKTTPPWKHGCQKKKDKYTCHQVQNKMLKVMALSNLRKIAGDLSQARYFCIMSDECTDASNREQLVICIRWVDSNLEPHEEFVGLYKIDDIKADTIVAAIRDTLI